MGQCMIMVWVRDASQPLSLNNLDHAAVRINLTSPGNAQRYGCGVSQLTFTGGLELNPSPRPISLGPNQVGLGNNIFTNQSFTGLTTQGLGGVLGTSSFRLIINNKSAPGDSSTDKHAAYMINMINGRGTSESVANFNEVSSYYNNAAVPLCFYLALRATAPNCNHQKAVTIVKERLQRVKVTRTGTITGRSGIQSDVPIDTYFSGSSTRAPLVGLGYSPF